MSQPFIKKNAELLLYKVRTRFIILFSELTCSMEEWEECKDFWAQQAAIAAKRSEY